MDLITVRHFGDGCEGEGVRRVSKREERYKEMGREGKVEEEETH